MPYFRPFVKLRAKARSRSADEAAVHVRDREAVAAERLAGGVLGGPVAAEDLPAALVQEPLADEVVDRPARLEGGVELHDRVRPEEPLLELALDALADALVADDDEAPRVVGVVVDQALSELEDVHDGSFC